VDHRVGEGGLTVEVRTTAVRAEEAVEAAEMVTIDSTSPTKNTNPKHQPSKIASSTLAGQNMQRSLSSTRKRSSRTSGVKVRKKGP
jgi:hypothetical protein